MESFGRRFRKEHAFNSFQTVFEFHEKKVLIMKIVNLTNDIDYALIYLVVYFVPEYIWVAMQLAQHVRCIFSRVVNYILHSRIQKAGNVLQASKQLPLGQVFEERNKVY